MVLIKSLPQLMEVEGIDKAELADRMGALPQTIANWSKDPSKMQGPKRKMLGLLFPKHDFRLIWNPELEEVLAQEESDKRALTDRLDKIEDNICFILERCHEILMVVSPAHRDAGTKVEGEGGPTLFPERAQD